MKIKDLNINKSWTLFLDRDGVINKRFIDDYICRWEQFEFLPGVLKGLNLLSKIFNRIIIVTNQQGIGKGLMTEEMLSEIHRNMVRMIEKNKGRIDKIYYSPFKAEENNSLRKPGTGMAVMAQKDFPEIIFEKSCMVGDNIYDMEFGKKLNMVNIFISDDKKIINENRRLINFSYKDLHKFSQDLEI